MKRRPRPKAVLLVLLLVTMINLPIVHSTWTRWKVERSGTDVTAPVVGHDVLGSADDPEYYVSFRLSREIDPDQHAWPVQLDKASYDEAVASRTLDVRVLPDQPSAYSVDGQVTGRLGLVITLLADLALLVMVALAWRFRGSLRPQLRAVATGDVERCKPGSALDKLEGDLYLIRGEVSAIEADEIVLDLGDRSVVVALDGHHNPIGYQQPAQVRGRLIG
jgi:hypothetical protein